ncbi:MAG: DUF4175 family protein [Bacteroidota bacterium]
MPQEKNLLDQRLQEFRSQYYKDRILRGSLLLALLVSSMLFVALLSEGIFGFSSSIRTTIVYGLGGIFLLVLGYMVVWPLTKLFKLTNTISDFQIADMVSQHFPNINDKLTNLLQLRNSKQEDNALVQAAINKKTETITPVPLKSAIDLKKNRKYVGYLGVPMLLFLLTFVFNSSFLGESSNRMFNYDKEFLPPPPFNLQLSDIPTSLVAGQDYTFEVKVDGDRLPAELFVFIRNDAEENSEFIDFNLTAENAETFTYTLSNVKEDFSFRIGNEAVSSEIYPVEVLKRPSIKNFRAVVQYPAYTGLGIEKLADNVGDFKVIKGSRVTWELLPQGDLAEAWFVGKEKVAFEEKDNETYKVSQRMMKDLEYFISLNSIENIANIDTVRYKVNILNDRYPSIYVFKPNNDFKVDLDPVMPLDLEIADDFGFTKMNLYYRFVKSGGTSEVSAEFKEYKLDIDPNTLLQPLGYQVDLTSLGLTEGDELEYYIEVWDNDGVSGAKSTTSATYKVIYPTLDARYDEVNESQNEVKDDLKNLKEKADELNQAYKKMQEKLLEQKKLSFDDKKEAQRMLEEHQKMLEELKETQQKFEETIDKMEENQMVSEETLEKYEELNEFLEEMDNPEIEELLKQIEEQMENLNPEDIRDKLEQLQSNEEDIKKSLERTLELLKQLEVQEKADEIRNKLDQLEAKQELLNEKLEQSDEPEEMENLAERQEDLEEQMEGIKEDMKELEDLKDNTETPDEEKMDELNQDAEEAQDEMEKAAEQMKESAEQQKEGSKKMKKQSQQMKQDASESQKKAKQKMQKMQEQLSEMQMNMQMQQDQQNLENLRELLENLLKLSFDQEDLRDEVRELKYGDPSLKDKSQNQKKLQDDMGLVKDSLESLANKMFQIQKFVLDESKSIEDNMKRSQTFFRNKQIPMVNYHQQSAMTSINNLANMLSDAMKQLQEQMKNAQMGQGMCPKPGDKPGMQQLGQEQRKLNQQMQQMKKGGGEMDGEKLKEMAARQEAIRKKLKDAHDRMKRGEDGKPLGDMQKIMQDMIQSETELLNKQLSNQMLKRQQEILSRLLQAEQSVRERELDDKRESKTAQIKDRKSPEELSLEEYKNKIRQELLKSNKLEYSNDFLILIEQYYKKLEGANEQ